MRVVGANKDVLNQGVDFNLNRGSLLLPFSEPMLNATFVNRRQRFLAEVALADGSRVLAYCANPGSLKGCLQVGNPTLLWDSKDPKRKRRYTWRAIEIEGVWVGIDTHLGNRLFESAMRLDVLPCFAGYTILQKEPRIQPGVRMDFLLAGLSGNCFLEVKNVVVVDERAARFPDSITPRGLKHILGLTQKARQGYRAVLLFVVQRDDVDSLIISRRHFPDFAVAFLQALEAGVEALALAVRVGPGGFDMPRMIPVTHD